jgi:EAL domain-containing protein (putative c-di-GMP-specific phosphodiesterase class I)
VESHSLGLRARRATESEVVAEGIEQPSQAQSMRNLGCDLGQGFLYARAMESSDILQYLRDHDGVDELPPQANAA